MRARAAAVIIKNDSVLLIHRNNEGKQYYVLPGGGIEAGEEPLQACIREVKEELGIEVKNARVFFEYQNGDDPNYFFLIDEYHGKPTIGDFPKQSETNIYEIEWVDIQDILTVPLFPEVLKEKIANLNLLVADQ
jgi:8-oxo-dGTP diphosphatase